MTIDQARRLLFEIRQSNLGSLRENLYKSAVNYARVRTDWKFFSADAKLEADALRTAAHNTFIDDCNILSRNMAKNSEPILWRSELGEDRKVIGDFACFIHCLLGLEAR